MTAACERLDAGAAWPDAPVGSVFSTRGTAFDVTISVLGAGDHPADPAMPGEEVGAILAGSFQVEAAGESYVLSKGEAIIIPPGAARRWTCSEARGVLYRVVVTNPAAPAA